MEEYVKNLEEENRSLKKENTKIIKQFTLFGQDLVNLGELHIGREPYLCYQCCTVHEGDFIKHAEFLEDITCLYCAQKKNSKM